MQVVFFVFFELRNASSSNKSIQSDGVMISGHILHPKGTWETTNKLYQIHKNATLVVQTRDLSQVNYQKWSELNWKVSGYTAF